ncbi:MAG TPA: BMP family ABC transporter substrate-binding protein, partial [Roseiflexaceae bacterium]
QYFTVPEAKDVLLSSAMKIIDKGVTDQIKKVADGSFKGGNVYGEVGLAPYHDLDSKVPADLKAKIDDTRKKLLDGSLKTGVAPVKPAS